MGATLCGAEASQVPRRVLTGCRLFAFLSCLVSPACDDIRATASFSGKRLAHPSRFLLRSCGALLFGDDAAFIAGGAMARRHPGVIASPFAFALFFRCLADAKALDAMKLRMRQAI